MSQGRCALHGHIAGPVQGWGMAHCHPVKPWSAVPASSALCGSVNSEVVFMAAGLWGVQVDKNLKNRPLQVESLQELELERLLGLCVTALPFP